MIMDLAQGYPSFLAAIEAFVKETQVQGVIKNARGFLERQAVFPFIGRAFCPIPFNLHNYIVTTIVYKSQGGQEGRMPSTVHHGKNNLILFKKSLAEIRLNYCRQPGHYLLLLIEK